MDIEQFKKDLSNYVKSITGENIIISPSSMEDGALGLTFDIGGIRQRRSIAQLVMVQGTPEDLKCFANTLIAEARSKALVPKLSEEQVNHPQHYGGKDNPFEPIKIIEGLSLDFHVGNAVKYILRAGKKNPEKEAEDLQKAIWYLQRKVDKLCK